MTGAVIEYVALVVFLGAWSTIVLVVLIYAMSADLAFAIMLVIFGIFAIAMELKFIFDYALREDPT